MALDLPWWPSGRMSVAGGSAKFGYMVCLLQLGNRFFLIALLPFTTIRPIFLLTSPLPFKKKWNLSKALLASISVPPTRKHHI
jgi:hypothetical protein